MAREIELHVHSYSLRFHLRHRAATGYDVFAYVDEMAAAGFTGVNVSANGLGYRDLCGADEEHFAEVRRDFERFFARLAPDGDPLFQHTCEGDDDMPAHIRTALTTVNLSVPIAGGELTLGTWQGIYVWEHRAAAHRRQVVVHLLGE